MLCHIARKIWLTLQLVKLTSQDVDRFVVWHLKCDQIALVYYCPGQEVDVVDFTCILLSLSPRLVLWLINAVVTVVDADTTFRSTYICTVHYLQRKFMD